MTILISMNLMLSLLAKSSVDVASGSGYVCFAGDRDPGVTTRTAVVALYTESLSVGLGVCFFCRVEEIIGCTRHFLCKWRAGFGQTIEICGQTGDRGNFGTLLSSRTTSHTEPN
ncbi:uncharacterized protein LOC143203936 [Rhynchophorus ferrugineus]|uniref:uncharacterized protein LOC143203936 n=1 Tax=Rhynchophorus ferrugineus TaxID=354439 RepID=UPI003FCD98DF